MIQKFDVIGMSCSACSSAVDKAVRCIDGVEEVNVNLLNNNIEKIVIVIIGKNNEKYNQNI